MATGKVLFYVCVCINILQANHMHTPQVCKVRKMDVIMVMSYGSSRNMSDSQFLVTFVLANIHNYVRQEVLVWGVKVLEAQANKHVLMLLYRN